MKFKHDHVSRVVRNPALSVCLFLAFSACFATFASHTAYVFRRDHVPDSLVRLAMISTLVLYVLGGVSLSFLRPRVIWRHYPRYRVGLCLLLMLLLLALGTLLTALS